MRECMLTSVPRQGRGGGVSTLTTMINGRRRSSRVAVLKASCPGADARHYLCSSRVAVLKASCPGADGTAPLACKN